jgi:mycothiol synthase
VTQVRRVVPSGFDWSDQRGDALGLRRVVDAATAADGAAPLDEAALLRLRHRGLAGSDLHVAGDPVAGFAWLRGDDGDESELALVVAPDARGNGLGTALLEQALANPGPVTAWSHGNHPAAAALAHRFGFVRVRDLWVMRRTLSGLPDVARRPGVEVRSFRPGRDEEAFLALNAEAFAGHPEQGRMARADLDERMAEPWFDPAGFFVAVATDDGGAGSGGEGELLGFHWTKVHDGDAPVGEVYVVGVSPRAQGMGLGRLLTLTGLHHLADRGLDQVLLYVEADNTPAIATCSKLGFTHAAPDTHVQYRRTGSSSAPNRE